VIPQEFDDFFTASAGVSGALIGLLFVAITVAPERAYQADTRAHFHARAASALLAFSNALVLSLAALVPGVSLGWFALSASVGMIVFALASGRAAITETTGRHNRVMAFRLVFVLLVIAGFQVYAGTRLVHDESDQLAIRTLDYVIIGCLAGGINRTWELMSMRNTNVLTSLRVLARGDHEAHGPAAVPLTAPEQATPSAAVEGESDSESDSGPDPKE
jgi:hypothetical protein